jgi:ComF family protein
MKSRNLSPCRRDRGDRSLSNGGDPVPRDPGIVYRLLYPFLDVFFTPVCSHCHARLCCGELFLCRACWSSVPSLGTDDPLVAAARERLCADGLITDIVSLYRFEKERELQSVLHELKYGGKTRVGVLLGRMLGNGILNAVGEKPIDMSIPVPLHRARYRERGFNQSELLCRGIHETTGVPVASSVLHRVRHTQSQTTLSSEDRKLNMRDAFAAARRGSVSITEKRILLVDDVITTGATIRECAAVLRRGGADSIIACSVALAS